MKGNGGGCSVEEGGPKIGQLALSKGPARMGIHCHVQGAAIPSGLYLLLYINIHVCLNIFIHNVCVFKIKRKILLLRRLKIPTSKGIKTCIYSWLNGQHGREH